MAGGRHRKGHKTTRRRRGGNDPNIKPRPALPPRIPTETRSTAPIRGQSTQGQRGGVMYGYGFDPATGVGGAGFTPVDTSAPYSSETGKPVPDPFGTSPYTNAKVTGGRRRKTKKGSKRTTKKKSSRRTRKMRGGAWSPGNVNAGAVRAEFVGNTGPTGPFTYGTYVGAASKVPAPGGPVMGPDGVMKA